MINFDKLEVDIKLRNKGFMVGQAGVNYFGLRISNIRIMKTTDDPDQVYIQLPCIKVFSRYSRVVWIIDDNDVDKFNKCIFDNFNKTYENTKNGIVQNDMNLTEVDPEYFEMNPRL